MFKFDAYMGHLRKASRALFHARRLQVVCRGLFCVLGLILCVYRALLRGFKSLFGVYAGQLNSGGVYAGQLNSVGVYAGQSNSVGVYAGQLNVHARPQGRCSTLASFRWCV